MAVPKPVVGLPTDRCIIDEMPAHHVSDEYVAAVRDGANALPLLIPSTNLPLALDDIFDVVDGLLITGAASNVAPNLYGGSSRAMLLDEERDSTTLPLLRAAIERAVPVLCICRGIQELNVALGGTLHQAVHEIAGRLDHREDQSTSVDAQYSPSHLVHFCAGGLLARLTGLSQAMVNSLHHQGIDRLAAELTAEATASDGQIEAVSMPCAKGFVLGVQWHPEWRWQESALSRAIFGGFGSALSALANRKFRTFKPEVPVALR